MIANHNNNNNNMSQTQQQQQFMEVKATLNSQTKRRFLFSCNNNNHQQHQNDENTNNNNTSTIDSECCYQSLLSQCKRLFSEPNISHFEYVDEDGDRITISTTHELYVACMNQTKQAQLYSMMSAPTLQLHLFLILSNTNQFSAVDGYRENIIYHSEPAAVAAGGGGGSGSGDSSSTDSSSVSSYSSSTDGSGIKKRKKRRSRGRGGKSSSASTSSSSSSTASTASSTLSNLISSESNSSSNHQKNESSTKAKKASPSKDSLPLKNLTSMPLQVNQMYIDGDEILRVVRPLRKLVLNRGNLPEAKRKLSAMRQLFEQRIRRQQEQEQQNNKVVSSEDATMEEKAPRQPFKIHILFKQEGVCSTTGQKSGSSVSASSQMLSIAKQLNDNRLNLGNMMENDDCESLSTLFICKSGSKFEHLKQQGYHVSKPTSLVRFLFHTCKTDNCSSADIEEWIINLDTPCL